MNKESYHHNKSPDQNNQKRTKINSRVRKKHGKPKHNNKELSIASIVYSYINGRIKNEIPNITKYEAKKHYKTVCMIRRGGLS